jgi:alanyl-tRNA synthetase
VLDTKEHRFRQLVEQGRRLVDRQLSRGPLTDDVFRYLHDTHGLPRDLVVTLLPDQT